jgi:YVTN family beta-propeller protein
MIGRTRRQALFLERYWTMLRRDPQVERPERLDPDLADAAARLSELTAELQPPGATIIAGRERIARAAAELADRRAWTGPEITPRAGTVGDAVEHDDERAAPSARPAPDFIDFDERTSWRRQLVQLAAAVLVFAIVAAVLVLVLRTSEPQPAELVPTETPTAIPSPTPGASITPTTLPALATAQPTATAAATATDAPTSTPEPVPTPDLGSLGTLTATIPLGGNPFDVALAAGSAWVTDDITGTLYRIDPATNEVIATIAVSESEGEGTATLIAATGEAIWVVNELEATIARIDPATNEVVDTFGVPSAGPITASIRGLASAFGSLWVTDFTSNSRVVRLDPESGAIEAEIPTDYPLRLAVSDDAVWVVNYEEFTLTRIDPATNQVVAAIPVGGSPVTVAVGEGAVWVGNRSSGTVSRVDPATNQVVASIDLFAPGSASTRIQTREVFVGLGAVWATDGFTLYRIDPATNTVVATGSIVMNRLTATDAELWIASPPIGVLRVTPAP